MIKESVTLLLRFAHIIVFTVFMLAGVFVLYATEIQFDPSFSSLISADTEFNTNERILANVFENTDTFLVLIQPDRSSFLTHRPLTVTEEEILTHIELIRQTLSQSQFVTFVTPPQISDDEQFAQLVVQVATPRRIDGFETVIDDIEAYFALVDTYPGLQITLTGFPLLLNEVNTLIISDNIKTILLTIIAIFLVLIYYFQNLRLTLITLSVPLLSVIFLAGAMSLFGIPISITLAIVGILTVGLGVDFAIHVIVSYESYLEQKKSHVESIIKAIEHLHVAIIASFLTTAAGFTALMYGVSPATQGQGIVLTMAIFIIAILTLIYFPCAIYVFGDGKLPPKNPLFVKIKKSLASLAVYQTKRPKLVLTILGIITIFMIFGAAQVGFDTSNENWIPEDNIVQQGFRESNYAFGNDFSSLQLVITSTQYDLRHPGVVKDLQDLEQLLLNIPLVEQINSPFTHIELASTQLNEQFDDSRFNEDFTFTTLTLRATSFNVEAGGSSNTLDEIREIIEQNPPLFAQVTLFGDTIRFQELGVSLGRDTGITTMLSFIFVFIIASALYMSITVGFTALLPIIIGIIWTVGFMGFFNIPFTSLSTGLIALVLGIGIDFSIHLVNSTKNYINEGMKLNKALVETMSYSGGALLLTSITTFIGFASLIFASLLGIQRLGLSLALSIASVFLVTIIMVPSILSLSMRKKK